jgi:syringate O-demethylase
MAKSLEDLIQAAGNPVDMLRNSQTGPNVYPGVPPEFTNWRDEQEAWQKTAVLFTLSFHMADLQVEGRDAVRLLSHLGINTFRNLSRERAKQFIPCSHDGHVIGDVILFQLAENRFNLVGRVPALSWIMFHAATGGYDVKVELDERSAARPDPFNRKAYRFQIQGPTAMKVMAKVLGAQPPEVKFFHVSPLTIAGRQVSALRHGMAGQPGFELFGPYPDGEAVRDAIVKAGEEFGLRQVGGRAYSSNTLESGWIPPLPRSTPASDGPYRQWLTDQSYGRRLDRAALSHENEIHLTPWEMVRIVHRFRARLHRTRGVREDGEGDAPQKAPGARDTDTAAISQLGRTSANSWVAAVYSMHPFDKVVAGGKTVGVSTWIGYSSNERKMLTLAVVDAAYAEPGTEVGFVWGEESGGTRKPTVERHKQIEIRAIVSAVPYAEAVRKTYVDRGWRTPVT